MEVELGAGMEVGSAGSSLDVGSTVVGLDGRRVVGAGRAEHEQRRGCGEGERPIRPPRRECAVHGVPFVMVS